MTHPSVSMTHCVRQGRPRAGRGRLDGAAGVGAGCLRSRAAGQRAPPAGAGPAACTLGDGAGVPSVTARDPAPAPAGLALGQGQAARQPLPRHRSPSAWPFLFPPACGPAAPGGMPAAAGPAGGGLDRAGGAERPSSRTHGRAAPGNGDRSRPARRHPGRRPRNPGRPAADDRGGDRRAAGVPDRVLPLAPARRRPASSAAARRRGAGPAQRADGVAAPTGRRARRTGANSRWTVTTSGSGTPRRSPTTPAAADTGSGGPSTGRSTASRSGTRPSPTGSSTTSRTPPATGGPSAPAPACPPPRPPAGRRSPGTSTPAPTPRPSGRAWPRSPAARSPRRWSPSRSP